MSAVSEVLNKDNIFLNSFENSINSPILRAARTAFEEQALQETLPLNKDLVDKIVSGGIVVVGEKTNEILKSLDKVSCELSNFDPKKLSDLREIDLKISELASQRKELKRTIWFIIKLYNDFAEEELKVRVKQDCKGVNGYTNLSRTQKDVFGSRYQCEGTSSAWKDRIDTLLIYDSAVIDRLIDLRLFRKFVPFVRPLVVTFQVESLLPFNPLKSLESAIEKFFPKTSLVQFLPSVLFVAAASYYSPQFRSGIPFGFLMFGLDALCYQMKLEPYFKQDSSCPLSSQEIESLHPFTSGVTVPIREELYFRGLVQSAFTTTLSCPSAILLSSVAFGAVHLSNNFQFRYQQAAMAGIFGVVLGMLNQEMGLLAPIGAHITANVLPTLINTNTLSYFDKFFKIN